MSNRWRRRTGLKSYGGIPEHRLFLYIVHYFRPDPQSAGEK
jgi:hypothetical protein